MKILMASLEHGFLGGSSAGELRVDGKQWGKDIHKEVKVL
jgi:hypothetical protein